MRTVFALLLTGASLCAQQALTLSDAEALAAKNHPQVSAALLNAAAADQVTLETHAAALPLLIGSVTGAGALNNSRLSAGSLNNPVIYDRLASGLTFSQIITDFGRIRNLTASAALRAEAVASNVQATREDVLLQVDRAYFAALRSQAILTVASQTVDARKLVADQVFALAASKLKSGLDLSFANVNLSEARLLFVDAQNQLRASFADMALAMGLPSQQSFTLVDPASPPALPADSSALIQQALDTRPELKGLRAEHEAALRFAQAEHELKYPTISALASAGVVPAYQQPLHGRYAAAGVNVNIPILNGRLFTARATEADLRAQAADQNLRNTANQIMRDVQVGWFNASNAYQRHALTAELLTQATLALDLARTRYDLGLSSIVELSQAQLNQTSAQITDTSARYDYQLQRRVLDYQAGLRR